MISGCNQHPSLPLTHVTGPVLETALDTSKLAEQAFQTSRNARKTALTAQKSAKAAAQAFALNARDTLRPFLGRTWSVSWAQAGFKNNTLSVPDSVAQLVEVLDSLETYFTANPTHANAALVVNAAAAGQRRDALTTAIATVNNSRTAQRSSRDDRNTAEDALVEKMRALQSELSAILKSDDERWLDFIGDVPADEQRPEAVDDLELDVTLPQHIRGSFGEPARADRFLVRVKVIGQDADFRLAKTVQDPEFDLNTFTSGARVQVQVVAANGAGESAPSPVAEVVVS